VFLNLVFAAPFLALEQFCGSLSYNLLVNRASLDTQKYSCIQVENPWFKGNSSFFKFKGIYFPSLETSW